MRQRKSSKKLWAFSVAALVVANALDAGTSVGRWEQNRALRHASGRFSLGRAIWVKSAASGGSLLVQSLLARSMPEHNIYKPAAIVNFAAGAVVGGVALHNVTLPRVQMVEVGPH